MQAPLSRRSFATLLGGALLAPSLACRSESGVAVAAPPLPGKKTVHATLGTNLSGPADWNTELPFVDVFRLSRPWISQREGAAWGQGPALALDKHGYVTRLEPNTFAETPLCTIEGGHYPGGEYVVLYEGKGKLGFTGAASLVKEEPGRITIQVDPHKGGLFLQLRETDPGNYVRNIRVIMPGFEQSFTRNPWHPAFLERWRGMTVLRFMDWAQTNNSPIATWEERPRLEDATFSPRGIAPELMIDLANRLAADPWLCIPHRADNAYVRSLAELVKAKLAPGRRVYVEYSNEVWNGQFEQSRYAGEQGIKAKIGEKPWEAAWHYTARRSVEIFAIWEKVFGGTERLIRVLPSQAGNAYVAEQILAFEDAYKHADVLAIAPYFGCMPSPTGDMKEAAVAAWTIDQAMDYMEKTALPEALRFVRENKAVADKYGLKLVAYEGGQHMVGIMGAENNEKITALFQAANRHPRMGDVYTHFLDGWKTAGGDTFCHFSSVSGWSKWGSWGAMEYIDDDPAKSPKFSALLKWAKAQGQPVVYPQKRFALSR